MNDDTDKFHGQLGIGRKLFDKFKWHPPSEFPERLAKIEVETYDGTIAPGSLQCDDNWNIRGYPNDLFNSDIVKWRYI